MHERPYNTYIDISCTGWDANNIEYYLSMGKELIIDKNGEIWTADHAEYVGRVQTA